ncbi:anthrone oxygenase family protein [Amycolatopsis sp. NPDC058986]|uniref:anthrone oxygenase family protein n=1 Tax=unclassified Amycolatopsis TaxID=2618356 RepID=UPI0036716D0C
MTRDVLAVLALVGSGVVAGVLFAVALSVLPALFAMPVERYVYAHQLLGKRWDPAMPVIVLCSTAVDIALAVLADSGAAALFAVAAALLLAVSVVSHFCNVPINRVVKSLDPEHVPDDWWDPRPLWRRWHFLRTVLALLAAVVNAIAVVSG